jgi:ketosteroid isomerase-like protein
MRHIYVSLFLTAAVFASPTSAQTDPDPQGSADCASSGPASVSERHREWILVGWEKHPGDDAFDFRRKLGHFYHWESGDVRLYDDFDPQYRVARSAGEYGSFWTEPFTALRSAFHRVMDGPDTILGGDLATSTLEFAARLEAADGEIVGIRTRSSLVWQCTSDGWKIVREHNSSRRVPQQEIDAIIPPP